MTLRNLDLEASPTALRYRGLHCAFKEAWYTSSINLTAPAFTSKGSFVLY